MIRSRSSLSTAFGGVFALLVAAAPAHAGLVLVLDDLGTTGIDVIVADNALAGAGTSMGATTIGDSTGSEGVVTYNGMVGTFIVNVTTGISEPLIDKALDLNSITVSGAAGSLRLMLTDTDYLGDATKALLEIGGTTQGTVDYAAYVDDSGAEFGMGMEIGSGTAGSGAFSNHQSLDFALADPGFSLTAVATVNHRTVGQVTSFDLMISVPEPGTMALLGGGLLALGLRIRRRQDRLAV